MNRMRLGLMAVCMLAMGVGLVPSRTASAGNFKAPTSQAANDLRAKIQAAQFLSKATFGPTMPMIDSLATRIKQVGYLSACEEWIDAQIALPATKHEVVAMDMVTRNNHPANRQQGGTALPNYRYETWWHIALTSQDQLRQRVAYALSQIFAVGNGAMGFDQSNTYNIQDNGGQSIPLWLGMSHFYDMLGSHAFGNYRDLLGDVTYHPIMGVWLSSVGNQKAAKSGEEVTRFPDENYAREIQQLFSVGIYLLEPDGRLKRDANNNLIPTYDNEGITEMARVFTGLNYADGDITDDDFRVGNGDRNFGVPMAVTGSRHDNNTNYKDGPNNTTNQPRSKTIFKGTPHEQTYNFLGNRTPAQYNELPAAQKNALAKQDIETALNIIADHPNVAPFISNLLIKRLVKSNPSRAYINRVTTKWEATNGDLGAVVKAILLDPEVLRGQSVVRNISAGTVEVRTRGTEHSRLREPVVRATALIRAMEPVATERQQDTPTDPFVPSDYFVLPQLDADFGQFPYRTPTVFNFYLPDYQTPELFGVTASRRLPLPDITTPEFEILNASTAIRMNDRAKGWIRAGWIQNNISHGQPATNLEYPNPIARRTVRLTFNLAEEIALAGQATGAADDYDNPSHNRWKMKDLLEHFDLLLCNGSMTESTKRVIYNGLASSGGDGNNATNRVEGMILAIFNSPDCAVED